MGLCAAKEPWDKPLFLRQTPLDGSMPYEMIEAVSNAFTLHEFQPGEVIIKKGAPSDVVYGLVSGFAEMILAEGKDPSQRLGVIVGVNNFFGGFALTGDVKAKPSTELMKVVGHGQGRYVSLHKAQYQKLLSSSPKAYSIFTKLIGLREDVLRIPFFREIISKWPLETQYMFVSLFRYQCFSNDKEYVIESGKPADRVIVLLSGKISLANIRQHAESGEEMVVIAEKWKLINLTSLFYKLGQNYYDVLAERADDGSPTQILTLSRDDFKRFYASSIVDCKDVFEKASVEYVIRDLNQQQRLFFPLVDEKNMKEFCSLWTLNEYDENRKICSQKSVEMSRSDLPPSASIGSKNSESISVTTKNVFHVIVGGSAEAFPIHSLVQSRRQMRQARRRELMYGNAVGNLNMKLTTVSEGLMVFSGKSRCLTLTIEKEDFEQFFSKIGKLEKAMEKAEKEVCLELEDILEEQKNVNKISVSPAKLADSPSRSDQKYPHTGITPSDVNYTSNEASQIPV
mmetsp:Transcript_2855/g.4152  ORF Transcript_2855/g.4152 Transcript_2855/m.4152 type:complete len:512 (-) Transcript_2855:247-1782(-)|eukprot:CAMPEP_0167761498 /NCGR_PEP_ID=MMETSP0110_2-20121227/12209_1 /TAXON_ID=629695 /ORGANISM="Gymnochlora sp., Strain CCMP2014" /LENGTH=511 /DNA_ID=CAMNT_0007648195 /DNA_START=78 /DNA_END=1613 /DNA_ORIENTATION=-